MLNGDIKKLNNGFKFIFIRNNNKYTVINTVTNTESTNIQIRILEIILDQYWDFY